MSFPQNGQPTLVLAPMEGVTDSPMRTLMTEIGAFSYCVSEFLRVSSEVPPPRVFRDFVPELKKDCRTPAGTPVQIQLLGGNPERLAQSALIAVQLGAPGIDLNFGCPAPTVNRHDGGATLLKYPTRIREIVAAVRAAVPAEIPVSAKFRLGWDDMQAIHQNADMAAEAGASWITIHGRTKMQGYVPPAFWGPIGEVRRRLSIPVVANGEIWTKEDFFRCQEETGCEHFMLGRGALANPQLSVEIGKELGIFPKVYAVDTSWLPLLQRFVELCGSVSTNEKYPLVRSKQWLRMANARSEVAAFHLLKKSESTEELFRLLAYPLSHLVH